MYPKRGVWGALGGSSGWIQGLSTPFTPLKGPIWVLKGGLRRQYPLPRPLLPPKRPPPTPKRGVYRPDLALYPPKTPLIRPNRGVMAVVNMSIWVF